jgi:predicted patatin/cPLA2 family phospholipase
MRLPFRKLVLGGGGAKGILHVGALLELAKHQPLDFQKGVYGSSIGSVVATYVAFGLPIENAPALIKKYLSFQEMLPTFDFTSITNAFASKGVGSMDQFEKQILGLFDEAGVDLRTKMICETIMPLYIVSSNLTDGIPTLFSDKVPLLDALKASCCIPGVFRPYELYGKAYIDGDILLPSITNIVPTINSETLILILHKRRRYKLTPRQIETMSPVDYIREVHTLRVRVGHALSNNDQTIMLRYPKLDSNSELTDFDLEDVLSSAGGQLLGFLGSKTAHEEGPQ